MDFGALGTQFAQTYYQAFESGKDNVLQFFSEDAMFTYENKQAQTHQNIKAQILDTLSFQRIGHVLTQVDTQPTPEGGALLLVMGQLQVDTDPPHSFSQVFILKQVAGSFLVTNSLFRLSLHNIPT